MSKRNSLANLKKKQSLLGQNPQVALGIQATDPTVLKVTTKGRSQPLARPSHEGNPSLAWLLLQADSMARDGPLGCQAHQGETQIGTLHHKNPRGCYHKVEEWILGGRTQ